MQEGNVITTFRAMADMYEELCRPVCKDAGLSVPAFEILLFLADNPELSSAGDVVRHRGLKANLVSLYVEKLVGEGYLERRAVEGDRRKVRLVCTGKAAPLIEAGRQIREQLLCLLVAGLSDEALKDFGNTVELCRHNLAKVRERLRRGGRTICDI